MDVTDRLAWTAEGEMNQRHLDAVLTTLPRHTACVLLHDWDIEGVVAGVVWQRSMQKLGFAQAEACTTAQTAPDTRYFSLQRTPEPHALPLLPGKPQPHVTPVSLPFSMWEAFQPIAASDELAWLAALDAGEATQIAAPMTFVRDVRRRFTAKFLQQVRVLVSQSRHAAYFDLAALGRALHAHASPRQLMQSQHPDVIALRNAAAEVNSALAAIDHLVPQPCGRMALLTFTSATPLQHFLVRKWQGQFPDRVVVVANEYIHDAQIHWVARSNSQLRPVDFFRSLNIPATVQILCDRDGAAASGHCKPDAWPAVRRAFGFSGPANI